MLDSKGFFLVPCGCVHPVALRFIQALAILHIPWILEIIGQESPITVLLHNVW